MMNTFKKLGCALLLTLALSSFVYAGDMQCPAPPPPPPASPNGFSSENNQEIYTVDEQQISDDVTYTLLVRIWQSLEIAF